VARLPQLLSISMTMSTVLPVSQKFQEDIGRASLHQLSETLSQAASSDPAVLELMTRVSELLTDLVESPPSGPTEQKPSYSAHIVLRTLSDSVPGATGVSSGWKSLLPGDT
jgi:uncharacterized membrane protein